jgi:SulP family sulfate permease
MVERHVDISDRWSSLAADFSLPRLPTTLITGLVMAMVNALLTIAMMTLVFGTELREGLAIGLGVGLVGTAAVGMISALLSGFPGIYAGVQDNSAAILGLASASIASSVAGVQAVETVLVMLSLTSLATGLVFFLMGTFGLGEIAKFVPFPVIGGLLAGIGYLIIVGSVDVLTAGSMMEGLVAAGSMGLLWPGLVLAAGLFIATRRRWPSRSYLWLLFAGIAGFHLVTQVVGIDKATSLSRGWLLGPFPEGGLFPGFFTEAFASADWSAVLSEAGNVSTVFLIVPLTFLIYVSALEIGSNRDLNLNRELRAVGWANLVAGAVGSPPGYMYLSESLITHNLFGGRRGPAVVTSLGIFGIVLIGGSILEFLPQFVISGLLIFFGAEFLYEWLWNARKRMSRLDYLLTFGIVGVIATLGFLPGVGVGLAAAIVLFVYRYSRIDVVKHALTAQDHQSNIERSLDQTEFLREQGDAVLVLELQGFIFFGTANRIVDRIRSSLLSQDALRFVILDFRLVTGVDSSAIVLFERIAYTARERDLRLLLTGLVPPTRSQFESFVDTFGDVVWDEPDLDHGLARCEDRLLEELDDSNWSRRALPEGLTERLVDYLVEWDVPAGTRLMEQGDRSPGIYLLMAGRATVLLEVPDEDPVRLRTLLEGTVIGEISLYRDELCTATVVADTECKVLHLTPEAFDTLCSGNPVAAAELHSFVARTLAGRVSHANQTIRALRG